MALRLSLAFVSAALVCGLSVAAAPPALKLQLVVPDHDSGSQEKRAVQVIGC